MAITITHAQRAAWQRRTCALLARLLTAHPDLPVITWTVGQTGATLVGHCNASDPVIRRADFATWCAVLSATPAPVRIYGSVSHQSAFVETAAGVQVGVVADIVEYQDGGACRAR